MSLIRFGDHYVNPNDVCGLECSSRFGCVWISRRHGDTIEMRKTSDSQSVEDYMDEIAKKINEGVEKK